MTELPARDVRELEAELMRGKVALKSEDATQIKAASEALTKASQKLAETMYKQAGAAEGGAAPNGSPGGEKSDVVDAEVVDD